ncbi:MAG: hypothetical protein H7839_16960 [Magnetococcus sp. YQC-5]
MAEDFSYQSCLDHVSEAWELFVPIFVAEHCNGQKCIGIDNERCTEAVGQAIKDLGRMAAMHLPELALPDSHKFAGFLSKWIAKIKPAYIIPDAYSLPPEKTVRPKEMAMINAYFALYIFRSLLTYNISEPMKINLLYSFHFRDWSGETLALLAYACEEITKNTLALQDSSELDDG